LRFLDTVEFSGWADASAALSFKAALSFLACVDRCCCSALVSGRDTPAELCPLEVVALE
jgi:hypothetical protein